MATFLFILNGPPYGNEHSFNGLRLADNLARHEGNEVKVFLIGDASACAKHGPEAGVITAIVIDLALLSLFAVQHSVMARPFFKRWWTTVIPPAAERSTYVLLSSLILFLMFWQWRPLPGMVWNITQPALATILWTTFGLGWLIVLVSTFLINHFDLFGLRQVYLHFTGQPYTPIPFQTPWLYRVVRHPIMVGFLIAFWATPTMSQGHLLFAAVVTAYVLIALQLEERELRNYHGETYSGYRRQVHMSVPPPIPGAQKASKVGRE